MPPANRPSTTITLLTPAGVSQGTLRRWSAQARRRLRLPGRIAVTIVTPAISQRWNAQYRGRRRPTNVLSFDYVHDGAAMAGTDLAGEILLCPLVIRREAKASGERYQARLKMLLEHGLIHLLGLDHRTNQQQRVWERYERQLL